MKKHLNPINAVIIFFMVFLITSCQEDDVKVNPVPGTGKIERKELALFTLPNGNTLRLTELTVGDKSEVVSMESGANGNESLFDYNKNSILDLYLALTPKSHAVPKVLLNLASSEEKANILQKRTVVNQLVHPININVERIPADIFSSHKERSSSADIDICVLGDYDWCFNNKYSTKWTSGIYFSQIMETYISIFSDSEGDGMLEIKFYYDNNWHVWSLADINPGGWIKLISGNELHLNYSRYSRLSSRNGEKIHWRGYSIISI